MKNWKQNSDRKNISKIFSKSTRVIIDGKPVLCVEVEPGEVVLVPGGQILQERSHSSRIFCNQVQYPKVSVPHKCWSFVFYEKNDRDFCSTLWFLACLIIFRYRNGLNSCYKKKLAQKRKYVSKPNLVLNVINVSIETCTFDSMKLSFFLFHKLIKNAT